MPHSCAVGQRSVTVMASEISIRTLGNSWSRQYVPADLVAHRNSRVLVISVTLKSRGSTIHMTLGGTMVSTKVLMYL